VKDLTMLDIRHFGPGHRRPDAPPRIIGMHPATIFHDDTLAVIELHFEPKGEIWEHDAPYPILFVVIEGRGMVRVGGEETHMEAGQAVVWPANVLHKAWAEDAPFTAIAVEMTYQQR